MGDENGIERRTARIWRLDPFSTRRKDMMMANLDKKPTIHTYMSVGVYKRRVGDNFSVENNKVDSYMLS